MHGERLGRWLLDRGRLTAAQFEEARRTRSFFGGDLGTHLVNLGYLDEFGLAEALADITGVPCADDRLRRVAPEVAARLSPELASRHRACPFEIDGNVIRVAMRNPRDGVAIAAIRGAVGLEPEVWVASERRLRTALSRYYGIETEGVRGLSIGRPSPSAAARNEAIAATGPTAPDGREDAREVGLDGLPLDAELSFDDQLFFRNPGGEPDEVVGTVENGPLRPPRETDETRRPTPSAAPDAVEAEPLERLEERLSLAIDRDDIAIALLEFCRLRASRCALFAITKDGLRCLAGRGRSLNTERLQRIQIPHRSGTVFDVALEAKEFYLGPVPPLPANKDLFSLLGGRLPPTILVVPIHLKGRAVAALYLDDDGNAITAPDLPLMRRVAAKAGIAFEILLLRGKLRNL